MFPSPPFPPLLNSLQTTKKCFAGFNALPFFLLTPRNRGRSTTFSRSPRPRSYKRPGPLAMARLGSLQTPFLRQVDGPHSNPPMGDTMGGQGATRSGLKIILLTSAVVFFFFPLSAVDHHPQKDSLAPHVTKLMAPSGNWWCCDLFRLPCEGTAAVPISF